MKGPREPAGAGESVSEQEGEFIMKKFERERSCRCFSLILAAFALTECSHPVGNHMNWQLVDMGRVLASDAGNQRWNTYCFQTVGAYPARMHRLCSVRR